MAKILPLVLAPDPLLQEVSKPVQNIDDTTRSFMDDMVKTMYNEGGIGLAAVQVGKLQRILVMDISYESEENPSCKTNCCDVEVKNTNPLYLINPEIIESSSEISSYNEGCLSFPTASGLVERPTKVKIKYFDYHGQQQIQTMDGILATCVQHEIDHLNGITFVDHLSRMKRDMIIKKMIKMQK